MGRDESRPHGFHFPKKSQKTHQSGNSVRSRKTSITPLQSRSLIFVTKHRFAQIEQQMGSILYTIAVILILVWAVAWFGYSVGAMVHSLLAMAALLIILQLIRKT